MLAVFWFEHSPIASFPYMHACMHARRYVMTSGATMAKTAQFFKDNNFFGIKQEDVFIFSQFQIPSLTTEGKLILNAKNGIALNPDGNGGLYRALKERGALDDMAKRGIEHVHVYCVDNVLVKVANPTFIGFCIEQGVHAGALVVPKQQPHEKVCLLVFVCMCLFSCACLSGSKEKEKKGGGGGESWFGCIGWFLDVW